MTKINKPYITIAKYTIIFCVLSLFYPISAHAQKPGDLKKEIDQKQQSAERVHRRTQRKGRPLTPLSPLAPIQNPLANRNARLVYIDNADVVWMDQNIMPDVQVLKGNVRFRHDGAIMHCDSAYFYEKANSLDAFSRVRIIQGDTLTAFGDYLFYNGDTKIARLRQNARLVNKNTTLTTDSMIYDRNLNEAYYTTGGKIVDEENTLTSTIGRYFPNSNEAIFSRKVNLTNPNYTLTTDSLLYNTNTHVARIVSPTHILYDNETDIFTNSGWYNTRTEQMMLLNRSTVHNKDGKTMVGDTIYYDKTKNYGEGFSRVVLTDSVQKSTLHGNYVFYNRDTEYGLATDSALLIDWSTKDTMYVHADSLFTFKDSIYNMARSYYKVRIYRVDIQGIADSLYYSSRDSIMHMHGEPVLWNENNQISGDSIRAHIKNETIERVHVLSNAIVSQEVDSLYFNQLSGKEIIAYIDSSELKRVFVNGNAETIYYPVDDADSTIVGINKTVSSYVNMYLKDKKVDRIVMTSTTSGTMYPLSALSGGDLYLKNYFWLIEQRPTSPEDVFTRHEKTERLKIGTSSFSDDAAGLESAGGENPDANKSTRSNNSTNNTQPSQNTSLPTQNRTSGGMRNQITR